MTTTTLLEASNITMLILSSIVLAVCVYSWVIVRDYGAIGYLGPMIYFFVYYSIVLFGDWDTETKLLFGRVGVAALMIDVLIWRCVFLKRFRRRRSEKNE